MRLFRSPGFLNRHVSSLLAAYIDAAAPCLSGAIEARSRVIPSWGPIFEQSRSEYNEVMLLLIKRQLTWGEAAHRQQQLQEASLAKMRAVRI